MENDFNVIDYFKSKKNLPNNNNTNPLISITENIGFYNIYISLKTLDKNEILLKYINSFLILNSSLINKNRNQIKYTRFFYLKNININKLENRTCANIIYLKIPKVING